MSWEWTEKEVNSAGDPQEAIRRLQARVDALNSELKEAGQQLSTRQAQLNAQTKRSATLKEERDKLEAELQVYRSVPSPDTAKVLQSQVDKLKKDKEELTSELHASQEELTRKVDQYRDLLATRAREIQERLLKRLQITQDKKLLLKQHFELLLLANFEIVGKGEDAEETKMQVERMLQDIRELLDALPI